MALLSGVIRPDLGGAFSATINILRLVCMNGLISKSDLSSSYRHVSSTVLDKFTEVMSQLSGELVNQKRQLQFSLESRVDNPESTMLEFNRQFQLNQMERDALLMPIQRPRSMKIYRQIVFIVCSG